MAGRSGEHRMNDSMRREFDRAQIANNVYTTMSFRSACGRNWGELKLKKQLQLFSGSGLLSLTAIGILEPLPRTADANQYIFIMTDRYS